MKKYFVVGFLILCTASLWPEDIQPYLPFPENADKIVGVFQTPAGAEFGTGFFFVSDKWIYVVTAKHVLIPPENPGTFKMPSVNFVFHVQGDEEEVSDEYSIDLSTEAISKYIFVSKRDIVAVRIGRFNGTFWDFTPIIKYTQGQLSQNGTKKLSRMVVNASKTQCLYYDQIHPPEDVIYFGYPSSLSPRYHSLAIEDQFDVNWPLYRHGIIAGKYLKNNTIIIDGTVQYGNSGGPVFVIIQTSPTSKNIYLIGLTTQLIHEYNVSHDEQNFPTHIEYQNSGYTVVEPMDDVRDLLNEAER